MLGEFFVTSLFFCATLAALPFLLLSYLVLQLSRKIWLVALSFLDPDVDYVRYVTVRSLLDTHRNQGIISVLLSVRGRADPEAINRHLQEVVRRRDKSGDLAFPRLRQCLVTRCGTYGWTRGKFDLSQHVTMASSTFKGRPITEYNIQEFVSDIVSKYLPTGMSPWQIVIIPSSEENHHILLKIHHMLLSEGMNIGEILPLVPPTRQSTGYFPPKSPLVEVFKTPVALCQLKDRLTDEISNYWNEFVAQYDPMERPELLKTTPPLHQFFACGLLALVSTVKDCKKGFRVIKSDVFSRTKYITLTAMRECDKRQVNLSNFFLSLLVSLHPFNLARSFVGLFWWFLVRLPMKLPMMVYAEARAAHACISLKYCPYPNTLVGALYTYVPLALKSLNEIFYVLGILFSAPKTIVLDILMQEESLQTITLCGRKSVAWSPPVKLETIKALAKKTAVSETEAMLAAVSMCLSKYFTQIDHNVLSALPVTMRHISSNYIFATGPNIRPEDAVSGLLCVKLPMPKPEAEDRLIEEVSGTLEAALRKQGLSHLLTTLQTKFGVLTNFLPATVLGVYLKYLSRKYCVSVTEVTSRYPMVTQRTIWGQEVTGAIYWRPPQANTSISLCLNEYADHVKLGVMCDTQLVPHHTHLVRGFPEFVQDLDKRTVV